MKDRDIWEARVRQVCLRDQPQPGKWREESPPYAPHGGQAATPNRTVQWKLTSRLTKLISHMAHCTLLHMIECTLLCIVHRPLHTAKCTLQNAHCPLHSAHYTVQIEYNTLHIAQRKLNIAHYSLHSAYCNNENWRLHIANCPLYIGHCTM